MAESYAEWFWIIILDVWGFANTTFFAATFGAMAGAGFGAFAAYIIAKKHQRSVNLIEEIRNINAAITLSYSILNNFLSLKDQIINPIVSDLEEMEKRHDEYMEKLRLGEPAGFEGVANMLHIGIPFVPMEAISEVVFGKITAPTRVIVMVTDMTQAVAVIKEMSEMRDNIISEYKINKSLTNRQRMEIYLGLSDEHGNVDDRFPTAVREISKNVNHCIFYSYNICKDLHNRGVKLAKQYGKKAPRIVEIKLTREILDKNLMPDEKNYRSWSEAFQVDLNSSQNSSIIDRLKFWKH